jgi:hypothetical protein
MKMETWNLFADEKSVVEAQEILVELRSRGIKAQVHEDLDIEDKDVAFSVSFFADNEAKTKIDEWVYETKMASIDENYKQDVGY